MTTRAIRPWALWILLAVLAFGSFAAALMTRHHEQHLAGQASVELLGCTESTEVSCDAVNTSSWSEVLGVPTATWAIPMYATLAMLALLGLRGRRGAVTLILVGSGCATLFSVWLFYIAETEIGFRCAWCIRMHGVNAASVILALLATRPTRPDRKTVIAAAIVFAAASLVAIATQRIYRSVLRPDVAPEPAPPTADESIPPPPAPKHLDHDQTGAAPDRSISAKTEDGGPATLTTDSKSAWKGSAGAALTVVEFADFQCGHCRRASAEIARVHAAYENRVLFVFKHYPLDPACNPGAKTLKHKYACDAAKAAECARQQGRFWAFHDAVFANQKLLGAPDGIRKAAEQLGLDVAELDRCIADPATLERVRADGQLGAQLGLHGTPRIFVEGILKRPTAYALALALERALGTNDKLAQQRARAFAKPAEPDGGDDVP